MLKQKTEMRFLTSAFQWKTIADTLKDILTECFFVFTSDSIVVNNVDPEKVVEIYMEIKPDLSKYFSPTMFVFPIYIQTVYRVLRGVKMSDTMEMTDMPDGSLQLYIYSETGMIKNKVKLKPLQQNLPIFIRNPRVYELAVTFPTGELYHILHDLAALSRKVEISVEHQVITFSAQDESGTTSQYSQAFEEIAPSTSIHNIYLLKFIEKYTKPCIEGTVVVRMDSHLPLSVVYYLENGSLELTIAGLG